MKWFSRFLGSPKDESRKSRALEVEIVRNVCFGYAPSLFANAEHTRKKDLYKIFQEINDWLDRALEGVSDIQPILFSDHIVDPNKTLPPSLRYLCKDGVPSEIDKLRVKLGQCGLNGEKVFVPVIAIPASRMDRFTDKNRHFAYLDFDAFRRPFPENKQPKNLYPTRKELEEDLRRFVLRWYIKNCTDARFFPKDINAMEIRLPAQNPNNFLFPMPDDVQGNQFHSLDKNHLLAILEIPAGGVDPQRPLCKY
ncbi:hypothetical protein IPN35_06595 [Candidatus Peregrinibacteria bacterium]|nr:MAG: hypothetical protein IPN35_06595 [Candidatus Peregrinibacteria bacterium]